MRQSAVSKTPEKRQHNCDDLFRAQREGALQFERGMEGLDHPRPPIYRASRIRANRALETQFVADVAHELRSPIAALRLELEEAQLHPDETDVRELLSRALGDVERLQATTDELLHLSSIETTMVIVREQVDLAALVRTALIERTTDRLPIRSDLQEGVVVEGAPEQLYRVLNNLLDNAQSHAEKNVAVEVCDEGGAALLAVVDDGAGVPRGDREFFERLTRLDQVGSSDRNCVGLALAIALRIAHAHSGCIRARELATGGARFELRLPRSMGTTS